jgi:hypothetical protein
MKLLLVWLLAMASLVEAYAGLGSEWQEERCIVALEDVSQWMSSNAKHLADLNDLEKHWVVNNTSKLQEIRKLHIIVKDTELSNYSSWVATIKSKYKNLDIEFSSIELEFNL